MKNEDPHRVSHDAVGAEAVDQFQHHQFIAPPTSFQARDMIVTVTAGQQPAVHIGDGLVPRRSTKRAVYLGRG